MEYITSRDNAQVKLAAGLLARKKDRDQSGLFVAEGLRLCLDAVSSGVAVQTLLITKQALERYPEAEGLATAAGKSLLIDEPLAGRIADTKSPQGVFAVCQKLDNRRSAVTIKNSGHYLMLHGIQDPGNLGTMLRTADALGIDGALLCGCPDLYGPKVLRGAMGGLFRLPIAVCDDLAAEIAAARQDGLPVYAAALGEQAKLAGQVDFRGGGAVLIGNEGNGLPRELIDCCTGAILIPMRPGSNSLNAAMAAGILLWEMKR